MASSLPEEEDESGFSSRRFWDDRYESTGSTLFDWYQDFDGGLASLLTPLLRPESRVLHLGCGNSPLAERLYDAGFTDVTSVDFSPPCIEHMVARNASARPTLRFLVADVTAMGLEADSFDLALEKGLLDAMVCAPGLSAAAGVTAMVDGVVHALAPGGVFVLVSYGPPSERLRWVDPHRRGLTTDIWTLLKPGAVDQAAGADGGEGEAHQQQQQQPRRFSPSDEADGKRHFVYVFTKPAA